MKTLLILILFFPISTIAQVILIVDQYPKTTSGIYLSSELVNWSPSAPSMKFEYDESVGYVLTLNELPQSFKFTQGSWEKVEVDEKGNDISNRAFNKPYKKTYHFSIEAWKEKEIKPLEIPKHVNLDTLYSSHLNRDVGLWIYQSQPISSNTLWLFMFDGQNLFSPQTAFAQEWTIDEILDSLNEDIIIVGIENGNSNRIKEYTPFENKQYGGGNGSSTYRFLVNELLPHVKNSYNYNSTDHRLGIGGSSLGGLIAAFCIHQNPTTFDFAFVFSPSFWINAGIMDFFETHPLSKNNKIVLYAGGNESEFLLNETQQYFKSINSNVNEQNILRLNNPKGKHQEIYWKDPFVKGLFFIKSFDGK